MSYQNRLVRTTIISRFSVICKISVNFTSGLHFSYIGKSIFTEHIVRSVRGPEHRRGVFSAQMRSSAASFAEISPDMILGYGVGSNNFV